MYLKAVSRLPTSNDWFVRYRPVHEATIKMEIKAKVPYIKPLTSSFVTLVIL